MFSRCYYRVLSDKVSNVKPVTEFDEKKTCGVEKLNQWGWSKASMIDENNKFEDSDHEEGM